MLAVLGALSLAAAQTRPPTIDPTYTTQLPVIHTQAAKRRRDAKWIWSAQTTDKQELSLQKRFAIGSTPHKAVLYITADNYFQATVNGHAVGGTEAGKDSEENGWRTIHAYDVTSYLVSGSNLLHVDATNAGGPAGVLARLEVGGSPVVLSDKSWGVAAPGMQSWAAATEEAPAGEGVWGGDLNGWPAELVSVPSYLLHKRIEQVAVAYTKPDPDDLKWYPASGESLQLPPEEGAHPFDVVVDFGKELSGRIEVTTHTACEVTIAPGESAGEAIEKPYVSTKASLKAGGTATSPWSSQRYARLTFRPLDAAPLSVGLHLDHLYYPVAYQGGFDCSDPLLTKLWYLGAYTAHLCMQQDIWDAPKRDRARWMGDLHVSGETINNVFLDKFLMEQTMRRLREDAQGGRPAGELPAQHVNGIPGYSCAWIAGLADFYRHTGDLEYVKSQHQAIITMIEYLKGDLGDDGLFANKHGAWPFVDWSPDFDKDTPQARAATHMFFAYAAEEAAFLLNSVGDAVAAGRCVALSDALIRSAQEHYVATTNCFGDRRQENAMAIYSGVATPAQRQSVYSLIFAPDSPAWNSVATPYYNNYVIFAMSDGGRTRDAMKFVRSYWGGMLNGGATSFWEGYDTSWDTHDFHSHLQADDGTGFFVSLCHGWSSGVTNWLTERVLGVRPTAGGFATCVIAPSLGDLDWVSGDVPTPHGPIHVKAWHDAHSMHVTVDVPKGVLASVVANSKTETIDARKGRIQKSW